MPLSAFLFVLVAALAHAVWNLLAKRASAARHLIWFSSIAEALLFLPIAGWTFHESAGLGWKAAVFLLATGLLHVFYFETLQRGYRAGDLSVVYPLARGTGPLLSFFGAILVLGERPSLFADCGVLMVAAGILTLAEGFRRIPPEALFWGVTTGVMVAGYTITDGYSVKVLLLSPVLIQYAGCLFRLLALSVRGWRERATLRAEAALCWKEAIGIAVLLPAGYILVLLAMRRAPVSQVAPIREMSMLAAAWFGSRLLKEGRMAQRLAGSALIAGGVAALAIG